MVEIFLDVLNTSVLASQIVIAILIFRFLFRKTPKWIVCLMWLLVGIKLVVPLQIESPFSVVPQEKVFKIEEMKSSQNIENGLWSEQLIVKHIEKENVDTDYKGTRLLEEDGVTFFTYIWMAGGVILVLYAVISYGRVKKSVFTAVHMEENVWQCETVTSPFIFGIIRPRIYLPFQMDEETRMHVIAHERAHLKRKDHWVKPIAFFILSVYWFNPFIWVAYICLCRDIELACDEKVIREMSGESKKDYASALLLCGAERRRIAMCPLAFGEVGVKERIKSVMNYKKPAFWVIIVAIIVGIAFAVGFLTSPKKEDATIEVGTYYYASAYALSDARVVIEDEKHFNFSYSTLSSYWPHGTYEIDGNNLILSTDDGQNQYYFEITEEGLVFDESQSSDCWASWQSPPGDSYYYKEPLIADGALFQMGIAETIDYISYTNREELTVPDMNDVFKEEYGLKSLIRHYVYWNGTEMQVEFLFDENVSEREILRALDFVRVNLVKGQHNTKSTTFYESWAEENGESILIQNIKCKIYRNGGLIFQENHEGGETAVIYTHPEFTKLLTR